MNIKTRPFTDAEIVTLLRESPQPYRSIFSIAYITALRISDLVNLPGQSLSGPFNIIERKTAKTNVIHPSTFLLSNWNYLLTHYPGKYLLPYRDTSTYRKAIQRICADLDIPIWRVGFHSIRKTAATTLYHNLGFVAATKLLNHSKPSTTLAYLEEDAIEVNNILEASAIGIQLANMRNDENGRPI